MILEGYVTSKKLSQNLVVPFSNSTGQTKHNLMLLENDWFDWECPNYLKWREKLVEKTIWEGQQRGFNGQELLDYYNKIGYKHISF